MSEILRVLQVEDSESDAALIVRLLRKSGYTVDAQRVEEAEPMRQALARQDWDVIIADNRLPQFDAAAALRILHETGRDIPFIVVSGNISQDCAVELMRAGAHDFVLKDRLARLAPTVEREIRDAQSRRKRRQAEEKLRDREEWLALVVGVTHLAMFDFYPESGMVTWTGDVRRHFGLPPDAEVTHETFLRALHPEDRERIETLLRQALDPNNGGEYAADYRIIGLSDGVERWLSAHGRVFFDAARKPVRFVGVTLEITDQKQLEDQFRQAQKMESIGRLAGGVAHDFNNLLTIISGYSQMMLEQLPPLHPLRAGVEEVLKAGNLAAGLTRQLLMFSRRQPSRAEVLVLNDLVGGVHKMLGRLVGAEVNLALRLGPAAGSIRADAGHLEQVIVNLVVNAKDAMPHGGNLVIETSRQTVDLHFAASHLDLTPGRYAALSVSDTGTGISPEVKAHIFEPFFTTKKAGQGTGLGLSTVYGIVKQCGGSISVASEPGRGTTFTILLPAVEAQPGGAVALPTVSRPIASETILLAEDDPAVRRFVQLALEHHGYQVLACSNGLEAIERARHHPSAIHLLLTDVVMPGMGGAELAAQFAVCRPGVSVLRISACGSMARRGIADKNCLQKPFTAEALLARIRALLDCSIVAA